MLICSGVIERTLTNIACKARVTCLFRNEVERALPFDLQASSGSVGAIPWRLVLELAVPQEVAVEGILDSGGSDVWVGRGVGEDILGIAVVVAAVV